LANLATKDGLIVLAGNGSSVEDRLKGTDTHFKAFEAKLSKSAEGSLTFLSKTQLFTPPKAESAKKEIYQRVLRLSPPARTTSSTPNKRIGAIASGLGGDENEIVVFSATSTRPQAQDIIKRIKLSKGQEANDLDIWDQGEGRFQVAYALDGEVYIQDIDFDFAKSMSRTENERRKVYTVPHPDASERKVKSKIRSVRWLSPKHLILLANKPNRTGVELLVLHLYEEGPGSIVSRKTLPSNAKAATDFDVALLDADSEGAYQAVVAVAGIDISLTVYTIDYLGTAQDSLSQLHKYATYNDVGVPFNCTRKTANNETGPPIADKQGHLFIIRQGKVRSAVSPIGINIARQHDLGGDIRNYGDFSGNGQVTACHPNSPDTATVCYRHLFGDRDGSGCCGAHDPISPRPRRCRD
jgi:prolactin regulatory element-binding protein